MSEQSNMQPGTVFAGDFRIVKALSAGGMGAVYVAEQISTGKHRAMKVMLAGLVADPALRKRFEQEARIGSLIESEHVVEVVGAGVDAASGMPWLAMELLQGEELAQVVERSGALPVQDVLVIFEQLCHAVGAAHRVGVVHRDLKPENIFLAQAHRAGASYMVKVLDFGIAKIVAEASTRQTAAMGSPIWMAPEQADQSPITPGTDVWALGLIAFYLLTGRPFWRSANDESATIPQVLKEVLFEPIAPASVRTAELGRALPPGFDEWFARCVARDPRARFPDAAQAGSALSAALSGAGPMPMSVLGPTGYAGAPPSAYGPGSGLGTGPTPFALAGTGPVPSPAPFGGPPGAGPMGPARTGPSPGISAPVAAAGTGGSYTLPTAPPAQAAPAPIAPKRSSGGLFAGLALLGLMVAGAVGGGLWWNGKHSHAGTAASALASASAPVSSTASTPSSPADSPAETAVLQDAKRLADQGNYNAAHDRLAQLAPGSAARQSAECKDIEFRWASEALLMADRAPDPAAKRALFEVVAQSTVADDTLRAAARERLASLDSAGGVAKAKGAQTPRSAEPSRAEVAVVTPPAEPVAPVVPVAPPAPSAPPQRSVAELANSTVSADWWVARRILEPKVSGGTATVDEVHMLSGICKLQHDKPCIKLCARTLAGKH